MRRLAPERLRLRCSLRPPCGPLRAITASSLRPKHPASRIGSRMLWLFTESFWTCDGNNSVGSFMPASAYAPSTAVPLMAEPYPPASRKQPVLCATAARVMSAYRFEQRFMHALARHTLYPLCLAQRTASSLCITHAARRAVCQRTRPCRHLALSPRCRAYRE